jgi:tetratricopeptide (TPR) repeat protein
MTEAATSQQQLIVARLESGDLAKALAHLHIAAQRAPDRADVLASYARALTDAQLNVQALQVIEAAEHLQSTDANALVTLALALSRMQLHGRAAPLYQAAARYRPADPQLRHNLAVSLMFQGDLEAAERELDVCLQLDPAHWSAYDTRAQLRRQTAEHNHVDALQALLVNNSGSTPAVEFLCMALSRECDDLGRVQEAFAYLARAKEMTGRRQRYSPPSDAAMFAALVEHAPATPLPRSGGEHAAPIFVVGLPRSVRPWSSASWIPMHWCAVPASWTSSRRP